MKAYGVLYLFVLTVPFGCSSDYTIAESSSAMIVSAAGAPSSEPKTVPDLATPEGSTCGLGAMVSGERPELTTNLGYLEQQLFPDGDAGVAEGEVIEASCVRGSLDQDWSCECSENKVVVSSYTLPADTRAPDPVFVANDKLLSKGCGWTSEFIDCFRGCRPIAECHEL
jgi:hypothetical protein